jgi:hypothetical protein
MWNSHDHHYDAITESLLEDIRVQRHHAVQGEQYSLAKTLKQQETQLLVLAAHLSRIETLWRKAVENENYDDAAHYKSLSTVQRNAQYAVAGRTDLQLNAVLQHSFLSAKPPPPATTVDQWIQHAQRHGQDQPPASLALLIRDYRQCQQSQELNNVDYTNEFMITIEPLMDEEDFNALKPIIFELEAERIVVLQQEQGKQTMKNSANSNLNNGTLKNKNL